MKPTKLSIEILENCASPDSFVAQEALNLMAIVAQDWLEGELSELSGEKQINSSVGDTHMLTANVNMLRKYALEARWDVFGRMLEVMGKVVAEKIARHKTKNSWISKIEVIGTTIKDKDEHRIGFWCQVTLCNPVVIMSHMPV